MNPFAYKIYLLQLLHRSQTTLQRRIRQLNPKNRLCWKLFQILHANNPVFAKNWEETIGVASRMQVQIVLASVEGDEDEYPILNDQYPMFDTQHPLVIGYWELDIGHSYM